MYYNGCLFKVDESASQENPKEGAGDLFLGSGGSENYMKADLDELYLFEQAHDSRYIAALQVM